MEEPVGPQSLPPPMPAGPAPTASPGPTVLQMEYMDSRLAPKSRLLARAMRSPWFWPISAIAYTGIGYFLVGGFAFGIGVVVRSTWVIGCAALLGLLFLAVTARLLGGIRCNRAQAALGYLEQAVRLNLPLPAMLLAAESTEPGGVRRVLRRLRARLEDGAPVGRALGESASGASIRQIRLIDAGENSGRLGAALRRLINSDSAALRRDPTDIVFLQWYPLILLVVVAAVSWWMAVLLLPRYHRILEDFHQPIPPAMQWLGDWSDTIFPVFGSVGAGFLLIYLGRMTAAIFSPRLRRPAILSGCIDPLLWHLPLTRGVVRGRGLADVCNVLADALEAGHTPLLALTDARELKLNAVLRRRVRRWDERVEAGVPLADAARAARMPKLLVGMLSSATGRDVPRALQFLARYYESRFSRAAELLRGAAIPALALGFGAIVLLLAYTLLVPLINMADAMCSKLSQGGL